MHETDGLVETIQDTMTLTDEGWVLAGGGAGTVTGESFSEAFKGLAETAGSDRGAGFMRSTHWRSGPAVSGRLWIRRIFVPGALGWRRRAHGP